MAEAPPGVGATVIVKGQDANTIKIAADGMRVASLRPRLAFGTNGFIGGAAVRTSWIL
jgi:hypothetical protein